MDVSIIIPIYNEQENIQALGEALAAAMDGLGRSVETVIANDGSSDDSAARLDALAASDDRFRIVHLRRNFGQTAAMMAALDHASGRTIVPMDGDLQNDPGDIPRLLEKLDEGYGVVSGWRKDRKDAFITRTLPSNAANWLISWLSGVPLHDYGCTLKAYRAEFIDEVRLYGEMHRFIPIYASWQGARVAELPVNHHPRRAGASKYGLNRIFKVILDLVVIKFMAAYSQKPIYAFGTFGLANFVLAFGVFCMMVYYKFWGGKSFIETPLPSVVVMFVSVGFMAMFLGLLADLQMRTYYEAQRKRTYVVGRLVNLDPKEA